ncbi:MAG: PKD domain-containing protein, partial [Flavobacteriales bacterium]|nr:PKD domain-containing protein [Flavobacteriales bacterium]
ATGSGGTGPYSYNWMPGNSSGGNISSLPIGTHIVTVTDVNGCTIIDSVIITEPTIISLVMDSVNSTCGQANGEASVVASGGVGAYNYQWNPTGGTGSLATGLYAGAYVVEVIDGNGCSMNDTVTVNDTPAPTVSVSSTTNVTCNGGNDATATATVAGGTAPFTYLWSPIGGTGVVGIGLSIGSYTVVVTDSNGCVSNAGVSPTITQPNPIVISVVTTPVSCNAGTNGGATANAFGGTGAYSIEWLTPGTFGPSVTGLSAGIDSVEVTDINGCAAITTFTIAEPLIITSTTSVTNVNCNGGLDGTATIIVSGGTPIYSYNWVSTGGSSPTDIGLAAGNYTVNITDANGCFGTDNVIITEPLLPLSATGSVVPTSCFGSSTGGASVTATGGTPGYSYSWSPVGGTSSSATGLVSGNYIVSIVDTLSCSTSLVLTVIEPPALVGSLMVTQPSCGFNNGSLLAAISGGTPPYAYSWTVPATDSIANGLAPGTYNVDVTDVMGCLFSLSATLTDIPGPVISIPTVIPVSCFGGNDGSATVNIVGGSVPFTINWSPYGGNNVTATGLAANTFMVTVTDSLGCVALDSVDILEATPIALVLDSIINASCNGTNDGAAFLSAIGGTGTYTYSWSGSASTSSSATGLLAGIYNVTVTDQNNCQTSISVLVTEPNLLVAAIDSLVNPTCLTSTNGIVYSSAIGGTIPYSYSWTNGQTGSVATNLIGGVHQVTVTDANGCSSIAIANVIQPSQVVTSVSGPDTICVGQQGTITATALGGSGSYTYAWQPGAIINSGVLNPSPSVSTAYSVVAYDQNGCPGNLVSSNLLVITLDSSNINAFVTVPSLCPGQLTEVYVQSNGTLDSLTYSWNNLLGTGMGPFTVSPSAPTSYVVTATNTCGVSVSDTVNVIFNPDPIVYAQTISDSACAPGDIQFLDSSSTGNPADQLHYWDWDFGDGSSSQLQNPIHTYTSAGTYTVTLTVTSGNGCTSTNASTPLTVTVFSSPVADFTVNSYMLDLPLDELICTNLSTNAVSYEWFFGDGNTSTDEHPTYLYSQIGEFYLSLVATNMVGCTDTMEVQIITSAEIIFPTAFTPNSDGSSGGAYDINGLTNDVFFPYTSGVVDFQFFIFNRWGELIFESFDIE